MDFKKEIALLLNEEINLDIDNIINIIEIPANPDMGDYSFPCFMLAKEYKKAPNIIAEEIVEKLEPKDFIENIEVVGAYINFRLNKAVFMENIIERVYDSKGLYGSSDIGKDKNIVLDYSSPNIAKPFHVGHLRSTVIGKAIDNIHDFLGYNTVAINHLGDWGTQFGKIIVAYKRWGKDDEIAEKGIKSLLELYVKFHDEAEKDPKLDDEARNWLLKMQEGDSEALELWKMMNDISMKELNHVYDRLDITFDYNTGESFYNDKMEPVAEELREKNLLVESEGAQVVDLEEYDMPPCLILRSDGGTLYPTRDIAAAKYRMENYNFHKALYVTGSEQILHFKQWFKVVELMGYDWAKDLIHVPFGMVSLPSGRISTREGLVVFMEDLLDEAVEKTKKIIEEKNPDLENKEEVAEQVGIGAVVFNDLYNQRIKDVTFSWDRMLNFEGETAPYVQYTYARANSILERVGEIDLEDIDYSLLIDNASYDIGKILYEYPSKIIESAEKYEPYILTRSLVELAQGFNRFYQENPILNASEEEKKARVKVVISVANTIKTGLGLLGIKAPKKM